MKIKDNSLKVTITNQFLKLVLALLIIITVNSCNDNPTITEDMLDGNVIFDPSIYKPEEYLVSYYNTNPTEEEKQLPVVIAIHGYSASTFEWNEFKEFINKYNQNSSQNPLVSKILVSQVLLGGHGRTYADFKNATWQDWQTSIKEEYNRLVSLGYKNINFAASSTACPLILNLIKSGYLNQEVKPNQIFMIDPIIIASNKTLSLAGILGPMLGYIEGGINNNEKKYWYTYRPQESLRELQTLLTLTRKDLEDGINLPKSSYLNIYKSKKDNVADPISSVFIYNGVNGYKDVKIIDSDIHVLTRLEGREKVTVKDKDNQNVVFGDILSKLIGYGKK